MRESFQGNGLNIDRPAEQGFNMIEIAISIGVIGIAIVSIMGLFAVGLNSTRDASDDNMVAMLVSEVVADRSSTPYTQDTPSAVSPQITNTYFHIPAMTANYSYVLYFPKAGGIPIKGGGVGLATNTPYYYELDITNQQNNGLAQFDMRVSWPANTHLTNRPNVYYYSTTFEQY